MSIFPEKLLDSRVSKHKMSFEVLDIPKSLDILGQKQMFCCSRGNLTWHRRNIGL